VLFNGLAFWIFFPIFFALYFATSGKARLLICLVGSYIFYGWWDWRFLGLIALLTGINYWCGLKISASKEQGRSGKFYVQFSVICSLAILGFFKYFNFFLDSLTGLTNSVGLSFHLGTMAIVLPVGISFYTFQTMSYTIDLYWKNVAVERSLLKFAVFVSFFPQLVAGPIVRAREFLPQLQSDRVVDWDDLRAGINMILWGLVLKVVMADNLAVTVDRAFIEPASVSGLYLLIGTIFYAFQIYGDFAGYSLVAIGLARMLGFRFSRNFNRPYFATSFSDFWRRWHISLSTWLRDYLYIPLGGNRNGYARTQINLMITMLLGGLWHGAAWTFVVWGGLHGCFLVMQRWFDHFWRVRLPGFLEKFLAWGIVMVGVLAAWVFFRASSASDAFLILEKIVSLDRFEFSTILRRFFFLKGLIIIVVIFLIEGLSFQIDYGGIARRYTWTNPVFAVLCLLSLSLIGMYGGNAFIYFQF